MDLRFEPGVSSANLEASKLGACLPERRRMLRLTQCDCESRRGLFESAVSQRTATPDLCRKMHWPKRLVTQADLAWLRLAVDDYRARPHTYVRDTAFFEDNGSCDLEFYLPDTYIFKLKRNGFIWQHQNTTARKACKNFYIVAIWRQYGGNMTASSRWVCISSLHASLLLILDCRVPCLPLIPREAGLLTLPCDCLLKVTWRSG